jgi:hypothetical protein
VLLYIDKIAALIAVSKLVRNYQVLSDNPWLLVPILGLGVVGLSDVYFARYKGKTVPHVVWHLCACHSVASFSICCVEL